MGLLPTWPAGALGPLPFSSAQSVQAIRIRSPFVVRQTAPNLGKRFSLLEILPMKAMRESTDGKTALAGGE